MTIARLEKGETQLTVTWMQKLAKAFECSAADLLDYAMLSATDDDVAEAELGKLGPLAAAIARRGLKTYDVVGSSVVNLGVKPGDTIAVDTGSEAIASIKTGDVVLVEITGQRKALVLRQFIAPGLLVTNHNGNNLAVSLSNTSLRPKVLGVVLSE